jgi:sugar lactone lactonase YvrE
MVTRNFTLALALFSFTAAGCGGGGGSTRATASSAVALTFPDAVALTDADHLILRGTSRTPPAIAQLGVNGRGVISFDAFANWSLDLTLVPGDVPLVLDAVDTQGRRSAARLGAVRATSFALHSPIDVVVSGSDAFVLDGALHALVELDLKQGSAAVRSDPFRGAGLPLLRSFGLDVDVTRKRAWVVSSSGDLVAIDLATGDRSPLSDASHGSGPMPGFARAVVDDAKNKRLLIVDSASPAILATDEATGNRTLFSDATKGVGPRFVEPRDGALDAGRARLLVADAGLHAIVAVELKNGDRTILSDANHGNGPKLTFPTAVTLSDDGKRAFVLDVGDGTIVGVDLASGDRQIVSSGPKAGPPFLDGTRNVAFVKLDEELVLIADDRTPEIVAVAVKEGVRELVQPWRIGTGAPLENPIGVEIDTAARRLFVADIDSVKTVDLATGVRSEFSQAAGGPGPALIEATSVVRDPAHSRLFVLDAFQGILAIDTRNGARELFADPFDLLGLQALAIGLALDREAGQLYFAGLAESGQMKLYALDVASRTARIVSDPTTGIGPEFSFLQSLSLTADGATLLAVDAGNRSIFLVDTATGDRVDVAHTTDPFAPPIATLGRGVIAADGSFAIVTGTSPQNDFVDSCLFAIHLPDGDRSIANSNFGVQHFGPFWNAGFGIAMDEERFVAYVTDDDAFAIHAVDLNTGTRVVVSR